MARQRVYRKDQQCPRCGSNWLPKYGKSLGKQTYRCGQCLYHFTEGTQRPHPAPGQKPGAGVIHRGDEPGVHRPGGGS